MKMKPKVVEIAPEAVEIDSEPIGVAVEGTEIIPAEQKSVSEKDIATLNNYADKKLQESTQLSEVMSTVPSIVQRGGIYLISTAVGLTSILLYFSKVPVWVEAPGSIVVQKSETVAPDRPRLAVEAMISDRDLAAVKPEMSARVKVNAYDFREFGTVPAQVRGVTPQLDRPGEFELVLDLLENELTQDEEIVALQPGLTVQVEMQTEKKRLLNLLFSK